MIIASVTLLLYPGLGLALRHVSRNNWAGG